jgi:hypothetical protein
MKNNVIRLESAAPVFVVRDSTGKVWGTIDPEISQRLVAEAKAQGTTPRRLLRSMFERAFGHMPMAPVIPMEKGAS